MFHNATPVSIDTNLPEEGTQGERRPTNGTEEKVGASRGPEGSRAKKIRLEGGANYPAGGGPPDDSGPGSDESEGEPGESGSDESSGECKRLAKELAERYR